MPLLCFPLFLFEIANGHNVGYLVHQPSLALVLVQSLVIWGARVLDDVGTEGVLAARASSLARRSAEGMSGHLNCLGRPPVVLLAVPDGNSVGRSRGWSSSILKKKVE